MKTLTVKEKVDKLEKITVKNFIKSYQAFCTLLPNKQIFSGKYN